MKKTKTKEKQFSIVHLDLTYEEIGKLALAAHHRDMKLNDYLVEIAVNYANYTITVNDGKS